MIFKVIYAKKKRICQNILIFPVFADLITYYKSFMHTFNKTSDYRLA